MKSIRVGKRTLEQSEVDKWKCYRDNPYSEITVTKVPINWYWLKNGSFDGVCIGPSKKGFNNFEVALLEDICGALLPKEE